MRVEDADAKYDFNIDPARSSALRHLVYNPGPDSGGNTPFRARLCSPSELQPFPHSLANIQHALLASKELKTIDIVQYYSNASHDSHLSHLLRTEGFA
jgi:hypothetical protein